MTCPVCQKSKSLYCSRYICGIETWVCADCNRAIEPKPSGITKAHLLVALIILAGLVLATCGGSK